jgi:hypothetical protein
MSSLVSLTIGVPCEKANPHSTTLRWPGLKTRPSG